MIDRLQCNGENAMQWREYSHRRPHDVEVTGFEISILGNSRVSLALFACFLLCFLFCLLLTLLLLLLLLKSYY